MKITAFFFVLFCTFLSAQAQTITALGGEWGNAASWSPNRVPVDSDNIIIPDGTTITVGDTYDNYPSLRGGNLTTITVEGGGILNFAVLGSLRVDNFDVIIIENGGQINFSPLSGFVYSNIFNTYPSTFDQGSPSTVDGPASISNGALPVTLISFSVEIIRHSITLNWATASEENFDYFTIERSADAVFYEEIGKVQGTGWSTDIINYSFTDLHPLAGKSYYRLKASDLDGSHEYFQPVMVDYNNYHNRKILIETNPVIGNSLKFRLNFLPNGEVEVVIMNISGKIVYRNIQQPNRSVFSIDEDFEEGIYLLNVITSEGRVTERFLKE